MPKAPADVLIGISEVGEVLDPYGTPDDESWGATEKNGVSINIDGQNVDVESGQSLFLEETFAHAMNIGLTIRLQYANLINMARKFGMATSVVTGDLSAGTPTPEVFEPIMTAIGRTERYLYVLTPGPAGTRRWEFKRCKIRLDGGIELAANAHQQITLNFSVLRPKEDGHTTKPIKITDAV